MGKLDSVSRDILGEGQDGIVYLEDGYAIKEFHGAWIPWKKDRIRRVNKRLKETGIPTYDFFEVDDVKKRYRMTDLSNNKKNLVVSPPDLDRMNYPAQKLWLEKASSGYQFNNVESFLADNRNTLEKLIKADIFVDTPGFMFIVDPEGKASMLICDYDDGVYEAEGQSLYSYASNDMAKYYMHALATVMMNIFPLSKDRIKQEVIALSDQYIRRSVDRADLMAIFTN